MKIIKAHPSYGYSNWKERFPNGEPIIASISFQLTDLKDGYELTPMHEFFVLAMERLALAAVFRGATINLPRSSAPPISLLGFHILPPAISFGAYKGKWRIENLPVPRVNYRRDIFFSHVHFDGLDDGTDTIDNVVKTIKNKEPLGESADIVTKELELRVRIGYNHTKAAFDAMAAHEDRLPYSTRNELTITLKAPWLTQNNIRPEVSVDVKDKKPEDVVALAQKLFLAYLDYSAAKRR